MQNKLIYLCGNQWKTKQQTNQYPDIAGVLTEPGSQDQHYPDLFVVGHSLDVGTCCNQSNVSRRNLRWQLSVKIKVYVSVVYLDSIDWIVKR